MSTLEPAGLRPGQHIRVRRSFYTHHGVYIGVFRGRALVAELAKPGDGGRVRLVRLADFAQGAPIEIVYHPDACSPKQVLSNVQAALTSGAPAYDLLDWNCEHFATWCLTNRTASAQVDGLRRAALLLAGCWVVFKLAA